MHIRPNNGQTKRLGWLMGAVLGLMAATSGCAQNTDAGKGRFHPEGDGIVSKPFAPTSAESQQLAFMQQPKAWFEANLKGPAEQSEGAKLNPKIQYVLETVTRPNANPTAQTIFRTMAQTPQGRAMVRTNLDRYWLVRTKPVTAGVMTSGQLISEHNIPIRIYRPKAAQDQRLPVLVYYHGGGFMFGSLDSYEPLMQRIALEANMVVVAVGYSLTPENPYPAAHQEARLAYQWAIDHVDLIKGKADNISVGGDSSGGNLALSVALQQSKSKAAKPRALLLYYPGVDGRNSYGSQSEFATGYGLDKVNLDYLAGLLYPEGTRIDPIDHSPIEANLCGLPPMVVVTGGFDPLRDQNRAFVNKASDSGVVVKALHYPSLIHGFLQMSATVEEADAATKDSIAAMAALISSPEKAKTSCKP